MSPVEDEHGCSSSVFSMALTTVLIPFHIRGLRLNIQLAVTSFACFRKHVLCRDMHVDCCSKAYLFSSFFPSAQVHDERYCSIDDTLGTTNITATITNGNGEILRSLEVAPRGEDLEGLVCCGGISVKECIPISHPVKTEMPIEILPMLRI